MSPAETPRPGSLKRVVRRGVWRVYGAKHPMNYDGTPYNGAPEHRMHNSWFWVKHGDECSLYIRVQGRQRAAYVARMLNAPNA